MIPEPSILISQLILYLGGPAVVIAIATILRTVYEHRRLAETTRHNQLALLILDKIERNTREVQR